MYACTNNANYNLWFKGIETNQQKELQLTSLLSDYVHLYDDIIQWTYISNENVHISFRLFLFIYSCR